MRKEQGTAKVDCRWGVKLTKCRKACSDPALFFCHFKGSLNKAVKIFKKHRNAVASMLISGRVVQDYYGCNFLNLPLFL